MVFGSVSGYVCAAFIPEGGKGVSEEYFQYPDELPEMLESFESKRFEYNIYFCPQVLKVPKRNKENVLTCPNLWADLDECAPNKLLVEPTITVRTSEDRWQAYWKLEENIDPTEAEDICRRIAYYHQADGADISGWDLSQLLRVPFTKNYKYDDSPSIAIVEANTETYTADMFSTYPQVEMFAYLDEPYPEDLKNASADTILSTRKAEINPRAWTLFYKEPEEDWSKALWQLELLLFESGLTREEVLVIVRQAACNKYRRDNRDDRFLWKEVLRAEQWVLSKSDSPITTEVQQVELLTDEEREEVESSTSIIEEYVEWAKTLGDAAWQYHQAAAFVTLSALLAGTVRLPTSYGTVIPNLWFMILADTTLTRKTTAMDVAMDMIVEIDTEIVLATDGSIEGLFQGLSTRPGRPSIFLRDEFSGLLEAMTKKDYYAGMAETLTKMYDGKYQKRVLRREVIEVRDPVLILFTGGIRTRIHELLRQEHVSSGFLPRFLFVSAESDITRLRPLGPPTDSSVGERNRLLEKFRHIHKEFATTEVIKVNDREMITPKIWSAELTPDAWIKYNKFEADLVAAGLQGERPDLLTPTYDRMAKSGLKMAVLLAAAKAPGQDVVVTEKDLTRAFYYIERWSLFTLDLLANIGKTTQERLLDKIYKAIVRQPGVGRSTLMQNYHLSSRDANLIFETLEQRGLITIAKRGKGHFFAPKG